MRLLTHFYFFPVLATTTAILVNRTIDNTFGDSDTGLYPTYLPPHDWKVGSTCRTCNIYPGNLGSEQDGGSSGAAVDVTQAHDGTWHDTTYNSSVPISSITVTFVGQAVYVYNIIANTVEYTTTLTSLVFTIDGVDVDQYVHTPDPTGPLLLYKVPVYVNSSLPHGEHTLVISAGGIESSLILFDYIVYTVDEPTASVSTSITGTDDTPTATIPTKSASASSANFHVSQTYSATLRAIIGGALGALLLVAVIVAFLWARIRCRRRLRRARAVPMCLTDKGRSAWLQTYLSSTTRGLRPLPSSIPRALDDFSTAPTPPASRFSRPPSGVASMPESRKHAARLRLFEKISTPHVGRARVEVLDYETPHRQHDAEDAAPRRIERNMVRELLADMAALREEAAEILTARMTSPSNEHEERIP